MKKYEKPSIIINEGLAEGVYAASGSDCASVEAKISHRETDGRYVVYVQANNKIGGEHKVSGITVILNFSQPVECESNDFYSQKEGVTYSVSGSGTSVLTLVFTDANTNGGTQFYGQFYVSSADGLGINSAVMTCHHV